MIDKILPVYLYLALGYFLRKVKLFSNEDGRLLLKLGIYVCTPALLLSTFSQQSINIDDYQLAVISIIVLGLGFFVGKIISKIRNSENKSTGTTIISFMNFNIGIATAFLLSIYGQGIIIKSEIFNRIHSIILFSVVYYIASFYGRKQVSKSTALKKTLLMPPLWAFIIGVSLKSAGIQISSTILNPITSIGLLTPVIFAIGTGMNLEFNLSGWKSIYKIVLFRAVFMVCIVLFLTFIFNVDATSRFVILLMTLTPIGSNVIAYSSMEGLDVKMAQHLVSLSMVISLIAISVAVVLNQLIR